MWSVMGIRGRTPTFTELDAKILKVRTYIVSSFAKDYAIQLAPPNKPCISLESLFFFSYRVSLAEYNWVLRILSCPVAGEVLCLLKVVTKCRWARLLRICFSSMLLLEGVIWASNMIQTNDLIIISKLCCFNLFGFETELVLITCDPIVILFPLQTLCMWYVFA